MRYVKIYSLLAIYLFSCIGLVINFHYCGGDLESVSLYHADEDGCCGDSEDKMPGCCKDKVVLIDTDDNEANTKYAVKNIEPVKRAWFYPTLITTIVDNNLVMEKMVIPINHAPPDHTDSPLFIKNSVLLI